MVAIDPRVRARLLARPGGSPLSMYPGAGAPLARPTGMTPPALEEAPPVGSVPPGISPLAMFAPREPPPSAPSAVDADVEGALGAFDQHQQAVKSGQAPPASTAPREIDARNIKGNYFDDELPPALQPKEPTSATPEKKPSKFWRILDAFGGAMSGEGYHGNYWRGVDADRDDKAKEAEQKALDEQLKNPGSKQSRAAQSKWRSYLRAAGWDDDEVSRMSAAELQDLSLADVSKFATGAIEKRDAMLAKEKLEAQKAEERRAYEQEEWNRKNGITSAQSDKRAAIIAGNRRAIVDLENKREDEKLETQRTREDDKLSAQARRDYELKAESAGIPRARTVTARLRANIAAARAANGGEIFTGADEAIRRGPKEFWGTMSPTAKAVMADLQQLQNMQIKDTSGQAVTVSEMPRVTAGFGTGIFSGEGDVERYIDRYEQEVDAVDASYRRAYAQDGASSAPAAPAPSRSSGGGSGAAPAPKPTGKLKLEDGSSAPDTPGNRKKLADAGVKFEVL